MRTLVFLRDVVTLSGLVGMLYGWTVVGYAYGL